MTLPPAVSPSGRRAMERCDQLGTAAYSDMPGGLFRPYLGPAHLAACAQTANWMREAGMTTWMDAMGSLFGRYEGEDADAPALLIGSHLDSVRNGGRYDGALGVMLGIECVATLSASRRRLPFPIEVVAFGDEEGSRFPTSMLCSKALAGRLPASGLADVTDANGITLQQALAAAGLDVARAGDAARAPGSLFAYLEAHIEQGPILHSERRPVAVVEAIAGIERFEVTIAGVSGHAGTVPMTARIDALTAAAEAILAIEGVGRGGAPAIVATVGMLKVLPGAVNVIPSKVIFSVEVRAGHEAGLDDTLARIRYALDAISQRRGVQVTTTSAQRFMPTRCSPELAALLWESLEEIGVAPRRLISGAGHDAMMLAESIPSVMLFIRCLDGVSHHPAESVAVKDAQVALDAMLHFMQRLEHWEPRHSHTDPGLQLAGPPE